MGKTYDAINGRLRSWVLAQPVFFTGTAALDARGSVNVSPKGGPGSMVVLDGTTLAYLDLTGSGAETIAHLRENGWITLMWCSFDDQPRIVRVHGRGEAQVRPSPGYDELAHHFAGSDGPGARAIIRVHAKRIFDACGYAVPLMDHRADRKLLDSHHQRKGADALVAYRRERNAVSLDGLPAIDPASG